MREKLSMRRGRLFLALALVFSLALAGCEGDDGDDGARGPAGPPGSALIDASTAPNDDLVGLDVQSEITNVTIASPPVVTFSVQTADGVPIVGIEDLWEASNRFVRFTVSKLVPGEGSDPDVWVAYTREETNDGSTPPDYDTGASLTGNGDGTYVFTFNTDVAAVSGVPFEANLTHRVAGQMGSGSVALEPQNPVQDFVPATGEMIPTPPGDGNGEITSSKYVAAIKSCNECHDDLVFHGRRFKVSYCVACHNPDLAQGEGDMAFMTHKLHASGTFAVLEGGIDYSELTYPQDLRNCRKCHSDADPQTPQGGNWMTKQSGSICFDQCHSVPASVPNFHTANTGTCSDCHGDSASVLDIAALHATPNATENNPELLPGQRDISYEISSVTVEETTGVPTIEFTVFSDGTPIDLTNLPTDLTDGTTAFRWPSFLLAYAENQTDNINAATPVDYNNFGRNAGQPVSVGIDDADTLTCVAGGTCTAVLTSNPFPVGATMRAIGLQSYFQQDLDGDGADDVSLHTQSVVRAVEGEERRSVASSAACAACHEIFEAHGGNRVFTADGGVEICTVCHVPNLSTSGRAVDPVAAQNRPSDAFEVLGLPTTDWPEDTNNLKEMIHGIHASAVRATEYEFVRGRNDGIYYNWSHVTFPAEASNCALCHEEGTYELPVAMGALPTTIRTTAAPDGRDATFSDVAAARSGDPAVNQGDGFPNATDWVSSPTASACAYCHDDQLAVNHMIQNGGVVSDPDVDDQDFAQRMGYDATESCLICHGPGRSADINLVHGLE